MNSAVRATLSIMALCAFASPTYPAASKLLITPTGSGGEFLGTSVSNAGDVNGDGYADVIVGASLWSGNKGRAYVYFGGPGLSETPDWTLAGTGLGEVFGSAVSGAGDVNGDGYDDVIVGAYGRDSLGSFAGGAYIFHGGPSPDSNADWMLDGAAANDRFGTAVSGAGDVNGDGYDDVIVGASQLTGGGNGEAFVYFGGPGGVNLIADLSLVGEVSGDRFGTSVSGAGDVNGDGYDDVVVGASTYDLGGFMFNSGRAYVFYGGVTPDAVADLTFSGATSGGWLGASVSSAGDMNLDGYDDIIVGALNAGASSTGEAYVFYGGAAPDLVADITFLGEATSDLFGISVSSAGDLNGDFYGDVVVGAERADAGGDDAGRAYVYFGGPVSDNVADAVFTGEADFDYFGISVSGGGDVTGDGFADVIVGAERYSLSNDGRAYVYDFNRFHITSPDGGETWPVGSTQSISWLGEDPADLWLSIDGGFTFEKIRTEVGGGAVNSVPILVPHVPTRFAVVKATKAFQVGQFSAQSAMYNHGEDQSDSLFTIESSVSLLTFAVTARPGGGAELAWASEPAVGPQGIAGYRLYRNAQQIGSALITDTRYIDDGGTSGSAYRLTAVNGLGEEFELGREMLAPGAPLAAWPMPYTGGVLNVSFAAGNAFGGGAGQVDVSLYDAAGRRIRTLENGRFAPGFHTTTWDGLDGEGRPVSGGIYFLNLRVEGQSRQMKVVVAP